MKGEPGSAAAGPDARGGGASVRLFVVLILIGAAVSVVLGVYGRVHTPTGRAITTFGFATLVEMKVALSSAALALGVVQVVTALRMYGRLGHGPVSRTVSTVHRISGVSAVALSLPVAFHCLWSLGFGDYSIRVLVHSLAGCAFYGVFLTKMLSLHTRRMPAWALPVLGGLLFTVLVAAWLTSALWFLTAGTPDYPGTT